MIKSMTIPNQGFKKCNICGEVKSIDEFYERSEKRNKGLPHSHCKICYKKRRADYVARMRKTKPEWFKKTQSASKTKNRKQYKNTVYDHYGRKCVCCGETEPLFLSIDHVNNDGAQWRREHFGSRTKGSGTHLYRWLIKNNFPKGFQVLCMNCQVGKRDNKGICPHKARRNDYPERE